MRCPNTHMKLTLYDYPVIIVIIIDLIYVEKKQMYRMRYDAGKQELNHLLLC